MWNKNHQIATGKSYKVCTYVCVVYVCDVVATLVSKMRFKNVVATYTHIIEHQVYTKVYSLFRFQLKIIRFNVIANADMCAHASNWHTRTLWHFRHSTESENGRDFWMISTLSTPVTHQKWGGFYFIWKTTFYQRYMMIVNNVCRWLIMHFEFGYGDQPKKKHNFYVICTVKMSPFQNMWHRIHVYRQKSTKKNDSQTLNKQITCLLCIWLEIFFFSTEFVVWTHKHIIIFFVVVCMHIFGLLNWTSVEMQKVAVEIFLAFKVLNCWNSAGGSCDLMSYRNSLWKKTAWFRLNIMNEIHSAFSFWCNHIWNFFPSNTKNSKL